MEFVSNLILDLNMIQMSVMIKLILTTIKMIMMVIVFHHGGFCGCFMDINR